MQMTISEIQTFAMKVHRLTKNHWPKEYAVFRNGNKLRCVPKDGAQFARREDDDEFLQHLVGVYDCDSRPEQIVEDLEAA